jgi:hypothetical protein
MNFKMSRLGFKICLVFGAVVWLAAAVSAAAQSTNGSDFGFFQIIGQRNIFDPNRVPHIRSTRSASRVVDSFSFVGTMSYARGTFAFFDGTSPDFRQVLELHGSIAGFEITAITPKSVTLLSGTNELVLSIGAQVRRDDNGQWLISTAVAAYAGTGKSHGSGSERRSSNHQGYTGSGLNNSAGTADDSPPDDSNPAISNDPGAGTDNGAPDASPLPAGGGANDALTRLMQQRAQEEQQLGQGSGQ